MIEIIFFLGGLVVGCLLVWRPFDTKYENGFLKGVEETINAKKGYLKDGRTVYFVKGLFDEQEREE